MRKFFNYFFCVFLSGIQISYAQSQEELRADSLKKVGNFPLATQLYQQLLDEDVRTNNVQELGKDHNNLANTYCMMGQYEKSTEHYFKALKLVEADPEQAVLTNYNIGTNYHYMGQDSLALGYINIAVNSLIAQKKKNALLGDCYNVLSGICQSKKDYENTRKYLKLASGVFKELDEDASLANVYINMAFFELGQGNFKEVELLSRQALGMFRKVNNKPGMTASYINILAGHFSLHEDPKSPNYKQEMQNCIAFGDSALIALKGVNIPEFLIDIYENKAVLFNKIGNADSAYVYLRKKIAIKDSVYNARTQKQVQELNVKYETEKKAKENEALKMKSEKQSLMFIIACSVSALLLLLLLMFMLLNKNRKKQKQIEFEKSILEYQQQALRAQMNPHFIFNAISSIQKYILKRDKQEAYDHLAKFARLIRMVLHHSQEKAIPLSQELDLINLYVELELLRFNNRFEYEMVINKNVKDHELLIPPMLIQPYVENAIWHGLMNLEHERKGKLRVEVKMNANALLITITDNGVGRENSMKFKTNDAHRSIGMNLTETRLQMLNKLQDFEKAGVKITDLYEDQKPCGTKVEIKLQLNED